MIIFLLFIFAYIAGGTLMLFIRANLPDQKQADLLMKRSTIDSSWLLCIWPIMLVVFLFGIIETIANKIEDFFERKRGIVSDARKTIPEIPAKKENLR